MPRVASEAPSFTIATLAWRFPQQSETGGNRLRGNANRMANPPAKFIPIIEIYPIDSKETPALVLQSLLALKPRAFCAVEFSLC